MRLLGEAAAFIALVVCAGAAACGSGSSSGADAGGEADAGPAGSMSSGATEGGADATNDEVAASEAGLEDGTVDGDNGGGDAAHVEASDAANDEAGDAAQDEAGDAAQGRTSRATRAVTPHRATARFRVVGTSPPASCATDFYWTQDLAGPSSGPVMKDWGVAGLTFGQVSYVTVPAGVQTTVMIYNSCNTGGVPYANFTPQPGDDFTVAAAFAYNNRAWGFKEEHNAPADKANLRVIDVDEIQLGSTLSPIDLYVGPQATQMLFLSNLSLGSVPSAGNGVDSNGYQLLDPVTNERMIVTLPSQTFGYRALGMLTVPRGRSTRSSSPGRGCSSTPRSSFCSATTTRL